MAGDEPITLKEVQLRLAVPQHILIHLCERGVVQPDFADTAGRGKRREFSRRNVFEFALALALRRFELPVATTAFVVRLLRAFAQATSRLVSGFDLPTSVVEDDLELQLHLYDGDYLVFSVLQKKPLLLGVSVNPSKIAASRPRVEKLDQLPREFDARLQINLSRIARRVLE